MGDPTPHGVVLSFRRLAGAAAVCLFALIPQPCRAQFTQRDGQIIARTLSFIEAGTGGTLEIGIAYAPDSRAGQPRFRTQGPKSQGRHW
jgi:hypothetical protein